MPYVFDLLWTVVFSVSLFLASYFFYVRRVGGIEQCMCCVLG